MPSTSLLKILPFHPRQSSLATILLGETAVSTANFPIISEASFQTLLREVPHLFTQGHILLDWLNESARILKSQPSISLAITESINRALNVLRTIVQTAAITAPTDLWLLHLVQSSWSKVGLTLRLLQGEALDLPLVAKQGGLNLAQLNLDAHLLRSRGVLRREIDAAYSLVESAEARSIMQLPVLPTAWPVDWLPLLATYFAGKVLSPSKQELLSEFFALPLGLTPSTNWRPAALEAILGHRLVPIVLAYHNSPLAGQTLEEGHKLACPHGLLSPSLHALLALTGAITAAGHLTALGARIFSRGPGPFGIIHAYHTYLSSHTQLLKGQVKDTWVARGENIAASQEANQRTFTMINDALDLFIKESQFPLKIFIEHAVGQGEAIRQRYARSSDLTIQYFGADLEDAAINQAMELQAQGLLPKNTRFIAKADIGDPAYLLQELGRLGVSPQGAVMVVGNGFHEVRQQTDDKMIRIFKAYHDAGILLIFAEESALSDQDLLNTAWNTYHAGFRFVHDLSGQGLRPAYDYDQEMNRYSWKLCAEKAGYHVHPRYTTHTRKIYPFPREDGYNPAISVNYFCIPSALK